MWALMAPVDLSEEQLAQTLPVDSLYKMDKDRVTELMDQIADLVSG